MDKPGLMHRKYSPARATTAPSQLLRLMYLLSMIPRIGTSTIYRPVIKAALPAVVSAYASPTCCSDAPANRMKPAIRPAGMTTRRLPWPGTPPCGSRDGSLLSKNRIRGISDRLPRPNRIPLKVNGST